MRDFDDETGTDPKTETAPQRPGRAPSAQSMGASMPEPQRRDRGAGGVPARLGRYEVLFELARGGMGTVYVGRLVGAHGFDRLVAIKVLSEQRGEADLAAFLAEARVTARITHPQVVQTLELGEQDGMPFIVMELVRGVSLSMLLRELAARGERLPADLAAWIAAKAAAGLHAAHELDDDDGRALGLVHRDVSPHNILLSFDGRVAVADFGIAKLVDNDPTRTGVVKGKFGYMSPEQALCEPVDRRSDVFSLGVVLHEALTGERLFAKKSPLLAVKSIVEKQAEPPHQMAEDVPEEISDVVMIALAKSREDRFSTAKSMGKALREALAAVGSRADDAQLAGLLDATFASRRDGFERRLKRAIRALPVAQEPTTDADNAVSHTVREDLYLTNRRPPWVWALGAVAVAAVVFVATRKDTAPGALPGTTASRPMHTTDSASPPGSAGAVPSTAPRPTVAPVSSVPVASVPPVPPVPPASSTSAVAAPSSSVPAPKPAARPAVVPRPRPAPKPPSDADRLFTDFPLPKP